MYSRALVVWFAILAGAFLNGAIREAWLIPRFGATAGHIVSTIMLSAIVVLVTAAFIDWIAPASVGDAVFVGVLWVALTLAFEFLAGHYLFGNSWERLLADYDVTRGRIWPLVLMVTFVTPLLLLLARSRRLG